MQNWELKVTLNSVSLFTPTKMHTKIDKMLIEV